MLLAGTSFLKSHLYDAFGGIDGANFKVSFWDGSGYEFGRGSDFLVHFKKKESLKKVIADLSLGFGEGYTDGDIEVEGDLRKVFRVGMLFDQYRRKQTPSLLQTVKRHLRERNSRRSDRKHIAHHYDIGNDFYKLWLDLQMIYSCAYFKDANDSLEQAQIRKIDLCCCKLQLQRGDHLLDIGCGWGGLLLHAAKHYGVQGFGITLSKEQLAFGRERIAREGLGDLVHLEYLDYRDLPGIDKTFDKIVSVGMFEHVGRANMKLFMECAHKVLRPGGLFLLHTIGKMVDEPPNSWIRKYIFPGSYCPDLASIIKNGTAFGLTLIDFENLRMHYGRTLDNWWARFDRNETRVRAMFDERFTRMWRLYLAGCSAQFWMGTLHLFQLLFSEGIKNDLPLTREWMLPDFSTCFGVPEWSGDG